MDASQSRKVILAALAGNAAIAGTKFAAAAYTGSSAMLSEAVHSLVDTGNQLLLLHGLRRAARAHAPASLRPRTGALFLDVRRRDPDLWGRGGRLYPGGD